MKINNDFPFIKKRLATLVRLALALLELYSCQFQKGARSGIGSRAWCGYEPLHLARAKRYYQLMCLKLVIPTASELTVTAVINQCIFAVRYWAVIQ